MKTSEEIRTERDPYLREIWAAGYVSIIMDECCGEVILRKENPPKNVILSKVPTKRIPLIEFRRCVASVTIVGGGNYRWISDADGSGDRFRNLLKQ